MARGQLGISELLPAGDTMVQIALDPSQSVYTRIKVRCCAKTMMLADQKTGNQILLSKKP